MTRHSYSELAEVASKMIQAGYNPEQLLTIAEDLANRGEPDDADYWQRVVATMAHATPDPARQACIICGHPADETKLVADGIQQDCVACGVFQVLEPLLTYWRQNPDHYESHRGRIEAYLDYCEGRGEAVRLNEVSMAMIKRGTYHL